MRSSTTTIRLPAAREPQILDVLTGLRKGRGGGWELTQRGVFEEALAVPGYAGERGGVDGLAEDGVLAQDEYHDEQHVHLAGRPAHSRVQHVQQRQQDCAKLPAQATPGTPDMREWCRRAGSSMHRSSQGPGLTAA